MIPFSGVPNYIWPKKHRFSFVQNAEDSWYDCRNTISDMPMDSLWAQKRSDNVSWSVFRQPLKGEYQRYSCTSFWDLYFRSSYSTFSQAARPLAGTTTWAVHRWSFWTSLRYYKDTSWERFMPQKGKNFD
jgi:hypothetical protein